MDNNLVLCPLCRMPIRFGDVHGVTEKDQLVCHVTLTVNNPRRLGVITSN